MKSPSSFRPFTFLPFLRISCPLAGAVLLLSSAMGQTVNVVQTNPDQSALLSPQPSLTFVPGPGSTLAINVDDTIRYQTLEGVGASFTDSAAWLVWEKLTPAQQNQLMQDLFSPQGIHLSFLRQPMGATDLALSNYTYDDLPPGDTDPDMTQFSIAHDQAYIIPTIKAALAANPQIKVLALPWSPPAWMKTSESTNGGTLNTEYFPALSKYFIKFIQAYEANGIPINYVAVQNEPLYEAGGYPTMFMTPLDEGNFIGRYLGPALAAQRFQNRGWNFARQNTSAADATPGIFGYEHNWDNPLYPELLLRNPEVRPYLAGISFHCYAGSVADAQNAIHNLQPGTPIWFNECTGGYYAPNFATNLPNMVESDVIDVLRNWAKNVTLWNMDLDENGGPTVQNGCTDCRGVVTIDTSTTPATIERNVEYYVLGHLSKYTQTGAYRIDSNTFGSGSVEDVAFKNPDGSIAVVVLNSASNANTFSINWRGQNVVSTLPAGAVATFTWQGYPGPTFDVTAGPDVQIVAPGNATGFVVDVDRYGQDRGPVGLDLGSLPSGVWGQLRPWWGSPNQSWLQLNSSDGASAGTYPVTVTGTQGKVQRSSTVQLTVGSPETPYDGTPWSVPGLIQAENFDDGGNGVGYFNTYTSNPAGTNYRPGTTVGVEVNSDVGGGYDVGYTDEGQWLKYTVNVAQSGIYNLQARVASLGPGGYWHVEFDGRNATGNLFTPETDGWQTWTTMVSPAFLLEAGRHVMRVVFDGNGPTGGMGNFNWFELQPFPASTAFPAAPATIPGLIQMENFDSGGKALAYWNSNSQNNGGANYRPGETVYIEACSDTGGGYDVGSTNPGDWLNYTVNVERAGAYTLNVRVATQVAGGVFHLALDGQDISGPISVPQTNGWQTWQTLSVPGIRLPAGTHTLQMVMDTGGYYNTIGNFNWFSLE
ncbi:MAG TPA: carbohydrate-binding protein [Candidatus Sulfotelmatobacter sp.]|jgi:glucosylceramidase